MAKRPSFQFYTGDWLKDPKLRACSPATRGIWIDLVCAIHEQDDAGEISGTVEQLARIVGCFPDEMRAAVDELSVTQTANVTERNGKITVVCRRIENAAKTNKTNAERQARFRRNAKNNEKVTSYSSSSTSSSTSTLSSDSVSERGETPAIPRAFGVAVADELFADPVEILDEEPTQAIAIYRDFFPTSFISGQAFEDFRARLPDADLVVEVWRKTLADWRLSGYKAQNIAGIVERYERNLIEVKTNGTKPGKAKTDVGRIGDRDRKTDEYYDQMVESFRT